MNRRTMFVFVWTVLFAVQLVLITYFQEGPLRGATYLYVVPLIPGLLWSARVADEEVKTLRRLVSWVFALSTMEGLCGVATWAIILTGLIPYELAANQTLTLRASAIGWSFGGGIMTILYSLVIRQLYPELDLKRGPRNTFSNGMKNG